MIDVDDVFLPTNVAIGSVALRLTASASGSAPTTVVLELGQWRASEPGFADLRFEPNARVMKPVVEIVRLGEDDAPVVVCGLPKWWIVSEGGPIAALDLYRTAGDDRGFYSLERVSTPHGVLLVYEGGLALITLAGEVLWHVPKSWNEAVQRTSATAIELVDDHGTRRLELRTGAVHSD